MLGSGAFTWVSGIARGGLKLKLPTHSRKMSEFGSTGVPSQLKVFVTYFGLARIEADAGVTMTGDLLGTLRYMAPEQALAKRVVVGHRADIYSLAVTLYELLTLRPAYLAEDRQQLLTQIAFEEPTRLRRVDPEIPEEMETIVLKAMSKDMSETFTLVCG